MLVSSRAVFQGQRL